MKNFRLPLTWLGCLAATGLAYSQANLVEKITRRSNELVIPYEKYVLPN